MELADTYRQAGEAMHDDIREVLRQAGGFLNCSNNHKEKPDMNVVVYDGKKGYSETFPIRAMRLDSKGQVEVYVGTYYCSTRPSCQLQGVWTRICNKELEFISNTSKL